MKLLGQGQRTPKGEKRMCGGPHPLVPQGVVQLGPTVAMQRETSRLVSWCLKAKSKPTCCSSQREILPQLFRNVQDKD